MIKATGRLFLVAAVALVTGLAFGGLPCYVFPFLGANSRTWCGLESAPPHFFEQFALGVGVAMAAAVLIARRRRTRVTARALLERYVARHDDGVRTGDFGPMLALFAADAEMHFAGREIGPFVGREAIARAFSKSPPDDTLVIVAITEPSAREARASYGWAAAPDVEAGTIVLAAQNGKIARIDVLP